MAYSNALTSRDKSKDASLSSVLIALCWKPMVKLLRIAVIVSAAKPATISDLFNVDFFIRASIFPTYLPGLYPRRIWIRGGIPRHSFSRLDCSSRIPGGIRFSGCPSLRLADTAHDPLIDHVSPLICTHRCYDVQSAGKEIRIPGNIRTATQVSCRLFLVTLLSSPVRVLQRVNDCK